MCAHTTLIQLKLSSATWACTCCAYDYCDGYVMVYTCCRVRLHHACGPTQPVLVVIILATVLHRHQDATTIRQGALQLTSKLARIYVCALFLELAKPAASERSHDRSCHTRCGDTQPMQQRLLSKLPSPRHIAFMQAGHQHANTRMTTTPASSAMKRYDFFIPVIVAYLHTQCGQ